MGTIGKCTMILGEIRESAWTDRSFWLDFQFAHCGLITPVAKRVDLESNSLSAETETISNTFGLRDSRNRVPEHAVLFAKQSIE
jgi:hypothetical protein